MWWWTGPRRVATLAAVGLVVAAGIGGAALLSAGSIRSTAADRNQLALADQWLRQLDWQQATLQIAERDSLLAITDPDRAAAKQKFTGTTADVTGTWAALQRLKLPATIESKIDALRAAYAANVDYMRTQMPVLARIDPGTQQAVTALAAEEDRAARIEQIIAQTRTVISREVAAATSSNDSAISRLQASVVVALLAGLLSLAAVAMRLSRLHAELARAAEESRLLALVAKVTPSAVVIADPDGRNLWVNDAFVRMTGHERTSVLMGPAGGMLHGAVTDSADVVAFRAQVSRREPADGEFLLTAKDGHRYWAHVQLRPVREDGVVTHLIAVGQDVTVRRQTEERLRAEIIRVQELAEELAREKELLAGVISAVPQLVFWKDTEHHYRGANSAYLDFRGYRDPAELAGRDESMLDPGGQVGAVLEELERGVLATGRPVLNQLVTLPDSRGRSRGLLMSMSLLGQGPDSCTGLIGVAADVTQVREMEQQLAQARRLESIGQLAAGIAHEINTPVQYIASNIGFLADATTALITNSQQQKALTDQFRICAVDCPASPAQLLEVPDDDLTFLTDDVPPAIRESQEGLARLSQIVVAMKDYVHPSTSLEDTDINHAIETTTQVCRNEWKYVATMELDLDPAAGLVSCYAGEVKQAILNNIVNAAHALAGQREHDANLALGTIKVSTRRKPDYLAITISDNGPGMSEAVQLRIFDPFFTTKGVGKGTGQGLSLARNVVVGKHHGHLDVTSTPGNGATFTIRLPLHPPRTAGSPADPESAANGTC